ncbi:MAG: AsmA-like C-terminal region-containing protein [Sneathiella sp.]|uniref:YhdP family protein n=1 Tax=Sneathiella sp. TaxID=1964365 RepID=UPI0030025459
MVTATSKIFLRVILGTFVLVFIALLAVIAGLARGPVSLTYLAPYVEQTLVTQYPQFNLAFDKLELEWNGRDKNLVVAVDDLVIKKEGRQIATIPDVAVTFSGKALLKGQIAPSELEFTGMSIRLTRTKDGNIKFGYQYALMNESPAEVPTEEVTQPEFDDASKDALLALLDELSSAPDTSSLTGYLSRVELYNTKIFIEDESLEKFWQAKNVDLFVWRQENGLSGQANGALKVGSENVDVIVFADYDRQLKRVQLDGKIEDVPLKMLSEQSPDLAELEGLDMLVSGQLHLDLDETFSFQDIDFKITSGIGFINRPDLYREPLKIDNLQISGSVNKAFTKITLEKVSALTLGTDVNMSGSITLAQEGLGLTISGDVSNLKANDLGRFWPYSMAVDGYNWVTTRIRDGKIPAATFAINLPVGSLASGEIPADAVTLKFKIEGAATNYFPPLAKVTDIRGDGVLTASDVLLTNLTGKLGDMNVTSDKVHIFGFDEDTQRADINVHVEANNKDIFTFLDHEPLGFSTEYGITLAEMTGTGVVDASFQFPLKDDLTMERVGYEAKGTFKNAFIADVVEDVNLSDANMIVEVDATGIDIQGTGKIKGIDSVIEADSWFKGEKAGYRSYHVKVDLDEADRQALDIASEYIDGLVKLDFTVETRPNGAVTGNFAADLTDTEITMEGLRWSKEAAVPGNITANINSDPDGDMTLSDVIIIAGGLEANGSATLRDSTIIRMDVPSLTFGSNDLGFIFKDNGTDFMEIEFDGRQFDLRPFVVGTYDFNEADVEGLALDRNLRISGRLDKLLLDSNQSLNNIQADMDIEGTLIMTADLTGKFSNGADISFKIEDRTTTRFLTFITDDAGSLFSGLDLYDDLREGKLTLSAEIDDTVAGRPATGTVNIEDVRLVDAPVLGKVLTLGSLGGIVDLLNGDGIVFATIEGPFTYENGILTTKDFRAVGSIGITITGKVSQPKGTIDAFGTVIPSYTLNSALGNIPILGTLLVGKKGEGIFGFSYKVTGGLEDPDVSVNAVSALAPGILRRMFFEPWDQTDIVPPDNVRGKDNSISP